MEIPNLPASLYVRSRSRCIVGQHLRLICADFKNEVFFLGAVVLYLVFYFVGKSANKSRANKWCASVLHT